MERNFYQKLFQVIKSESSPWMFSKSCNFLEVHDSTENGFQVITKGGKQQYYKKRKKIRYFNIINIA